MQPLNEFLLLIDFVDRFDLTNCCMIMTPLIDELVGKIAAQDDSRAYEQLFRLYYERLRQFAFSFTRSRESAEEVVSDVFMKLWVKRKSLLKIHNKHLYFYICTKNLSLNRIAKEKKNSSFSLDECEVEIKSIYYDPEQLMITAEMVRRIQDAINQLPPKCKLIFKMIKDDGFKYKEVAELLASL